MHFLGQRASACCLLRNDGMVAWSAASCAMLLAIRWMTVLFPKWPHCHTDKPITGFRFRRMSGVFLDRQQQKCTASVAEVTLAALARTRL